MAEEQVAVHVDATAAPVDDVKIVFANLMVILKDLVAIRTEVKDLDLAAALRDIQEVVGKAKEGLAALKDLVDQLKAIKTP